jgi:hypothetical protein
VFTEGNILYHPEVMHTCAEVNTMDISYSRKNQKSIELPLVLLTFRKRKFVALQFDFVVAGRTGSPKI